ncbi:MAG: hypothetical protein OEU95_07935, partial [Nitrospirota bacterium]|nr:hypothetical protein [Nitrospirota bacterium]
MRTKLFLAFIFIITLALVSNVLFERFMIRDFNDFLKGTEEDQVYWIMAAVEGSYTGGAWDRPRLIEALHWGGMLGFEAFVEDISGGRILSSAEAFSSLDPSMKKKMDPILKLPAGTGEFAWYPLYVEGQEIGKLYIRKTGRSGAAALKEESFRKRGKEFLVISFLLAGGGAMVLSVLFTMFISAPVRRLTDSAEKIAKGDFAVQGPKTHKAFRDEI